MSYVQTGSGFVLYSGAVSNVTDITSGRVATQTLGSVQVSSIVGALPVWTGVGSVTVKDIYEGSIVHKSFDWDAICIGSVVYTPPTGSRVMLTGLVASASGASLMTLFCGDNSKDNRIAKVALANYGGFTRDYTRPYTGHVNSGVQLSISGTSPVGFVTIEGFLRGS